MPIIKHSQIGRVPAEALALDLADLSRQAERIVGEAKQCADRIIDEARTEARRRIESAVEAARRDAESEGRERGRAEGVREARETTLETLQPRLEAVVAAWEAAVQTWEAERREMLVNAREDVLAFAMELSRKVVQRWIQMDPSIVNDQLAEALAMISRPSEVDVVIHPEDRPLVEEYLPRLTEDIGRCSSIRLRDDDTIGRGGCRVVTAGGEIDATIETQMERIADTLLPHVDVATRLGGAATTEP